MTSIKKGGNTKKSAPAKAKVQDAKVADKATEAQNDAKEALNEKTGTEEVEKVKDIEDVQDELEKEIPEPETETEEVNEDLITKEEDFETFNHECPDGSIFDREDLAIDWCKMRKMDIGKIKRIKK